MNKMLKSAIAVCVLLMFNFNVVHADPLNDQLNNQKQQLERDKSLLKNVEDKREDLESSIEHMDDEIQDIITNVADNKKQITDIDKQIKETEKELVKYEEEAQKQREMLGKRLRVIYMNGQMSYLTALLEADGLSDLMSRLETIKTVIKYDRQVAAAAKESEDRLNNKKVELASKQDKLRALNAENEKKLADKNNVIASQQKLIDELEKQERLYASKVDASQALVDATMKQIQAIRDSVPKISSTNTPAKISDNSIIAYATNFIGTKYVWGGTTPDPGFDCSGFTRYVYAHFGIKLGRSTRDQIKDGVAVSRDQLQPGDLVFFGTGGVPHHMGLYVGNNTYIHSPRTGDRVKISAMTRKDYITARRVR